MLAAELAQYFRDHIPLSSAMGVSVLEVAEDSVTLQAPLAPNINHRHTVFGGSASALAILAGWALLHVRLRAEGIADRLVIQRNVMEYEHPIPGAFTARAALEHPDRWRSVESHREFRAAFALEYAELDARCAHLTAQETALGEFDEASP